MNKDSVPNAQFGLKLKNQTDNKFNFTRER
jgi:hypothetical protein